MLRSMHVRPGPRGRQGSIRSNRHEPAAGSDSNQRCEIEGSVRLQNASDAQLGQVSTLSVGIESGKNLPARGPPRHPPSCSRAAERSDSFGSHPDVGRHPGRYRAHRTQFRIVDRRPSICSRRFLGAIERALSRVRADLCRRRGPESRCFVREGQYRGSAGDRRAVQYPFDTDADDLPQQHHRLCQSGRAAGRRAGRGAARCASARHGAGTAQGGQRGWGRTGRTPPRRPPMSTRRLQRTRASSRSKPIYAHRFADQDQR